MSESHQQKLQMQQIRKMEFKFFSKKSVASVISVDKNPVDGLMNAI